MEATTSLGGRWSSFPGHLLESISDHLALADSLNFRAVCRHWRSSSSAWSNITKFARDEPCLMFYDLPNGGNDGSGTTTCYFYSRDHAECCVARLPHLQGATVVMSKLNWLLVHRHNDDFFFFNPFTLEKIDLPKHTVASDQVYTFQKHPRFNSCIVIIVTRWSDSVLEVSTVCLVRDSKWSKRTIDVSRVQFGKLTYVMPWHDQTICISDSKSMFTVNPHERQLYLKYFDRGLEGAESHEVIPIKEIPNRDWLTRFGDEKGLLIRYADCIRRHESGDYFEGSSSMTITDDEAPGELPVVKAAWVEPLCISI